MKLAARLLTTVKRRDTITDMPSPKRLLLQHLYPGDLAADVAQLAAEGKSWRGIANTVSTRSGVTVSHESLRNWFGADDAPAPLDAA